MRLHRSVARAPQYALFFEFGPRRRWERHDDFRYGRRRRRRRSCHPRFQRRPRGASDAGGIASRRPAPAGAPPVSLVQPLCGVEAFSKETLASIFALDYPDYEILFCLADPTDPIAPLVRRAIAAQPAAFRRDC